MLILLRTELVFEDFPGLLFSCDLGTRSYLVSSHFEKKLISVPIFDFCDQFPCFLL
jgi:hypothetical protein